jgi:hypothetical protein
VHQGLLCWCPIPHLALIAKLRLVLVAIEATLTYALWAMRSKNSYSGRSSICPWPREDLEYDGTCTHCALNDHVFGDFGPNDQKLVVKAPALKRKRKRTEYLARWAAENPDKVKANYDKSAAEAKAKKTYYCDVCNLACEKPKDLDKHNKSKRHLRLVQEHEAGTVRRWYCKLCDKRLYPEKRS